MVTRKSHGMGMSVTHKDGGKARQGSPWLQPAFLRRSSRTASTRSTTWRYSSFSLGSSGGALDAGLEEPAETVTGVLLEWWRVLPSALRPCFTG